MKGEKFNFIILMQIILQMSSVLMLMLITLCQGSYSQPDPIFVTASLMHICTAFFPSLFNNEQCIHFLAFYDMAAGLQTSSMCWRVLSRAFGDGIGSEGETASPWFF